MHPVRALFDHETWANRELLLRCAEMDPVLLASETPGTLGTIPRTMTHVVGTGQFLLALLTGQKTADPILAGQERDLAELAPVAEENAAGWRALLDGSPEPDAPIWPEDKGPDRWVLLVQCIHHGDSHRAHVGSVLGAAGAEPPRIDGWGFGLTDPPDGGPVGEWADGLLVRCFDHAGWATHLVLEHCVALGEAALGATAPGTYGTVHETLTHLVDAHGDSHRAHVGSVLGAAGAEPPRIDGWGFGLTDPPDGGRVGEWAEGLLVRCFDHAGWATHLVLEHCVALGEAALGATAPGTYGTVHETLTHLVDAHGDYVRRLTGVEDDIFLEGAVEPDVLREYLERGRAGWRAYLEGGPDHERLVPAGRRAAPAWVVTLQAVHHASDHLAHVGTILGANGLPVPDADAWAYGTTLGAHPAS